MTEPLDDARFLAWLELGPTEPPAHVISEAIAGVRTTPQVRRLGLPVLRPSLATRLVVAVVLVALVGGALLAALSMRRVTSAPTGSWLVFDSGGEIVVQAPDGSGRRMVAIGPTFDVAPSWSPDGGLIAFWSGSEGPSGASWILDASLVVVDADGTHRQVLDTTPQASVDVPPAWSPDGTRLAYLAAGPDEMTEIRVVALDRPNPRVIAHLHVAPASVAMAPDWAPDGSSLIYSAFAGTNAADNEIHEVKPDGTGDRIVAHGAGPVRWSPDGQQLVATGGGAGGRVGVRVIDGSTGATQVIFDGPQMVVEPAWSPDGSSIALEGGEDAAAFWVVGRSGEPRQVVAGRGGGHLRNGPVWSPDGRSIAGIARLPEGTAIGIWPVDGSTAGTYLPAADAHGVDWWGSAG